MTTEAIQKLAEEYCKDVEDLGDGDGVHSIDQVDDAYTAGALMMQEEVDKWKEMARILYDELKWATQCCYEEASSADNAISKLKIYEQMINQ
jgi:hypothetical protein